MANNMFSQKAVTLNEASMEEVALKIKNAAEEIKNELELIKSEVQGVDNSWKDKNAATYIEKFQELQQEFPAFYNNANSFSTFLTGVVTAYRENVLNPASKAVNSNDNE